MSQSFKKKALLALADGTVFEGYALGYEGETSGEVVFNTAMTGYQEILTDPSYRGQMVVMTCPHIGNYGMAREDSESRRPWVEGFIVKEATRNPSNWRSMQSLHDYMVDRHIVGIEGIDTRYLTRHLRDHGSQSGIISHSEFNEERLIQRAREIPSISGRDLVSEVTCEASYQWTEGSGDWASDSLHSVQEGRHDSDRPFRVALYDFGVKQNILRSLVDLGCMVTVVPASTPADTICQSDVDGIVLSNGPGDPEGPNYAVSEVQKLIGWRPLLGICLGHQILGLALNLKAYKLKFGHHGANHPVMDIRSRKVEITSQNHNFGVGDPTLLKNNGQDAVFDTDWGPFQVTHLSLNDQCIEGIAALEAPVLSVQYHPEASPGPHDSGYLFHQFVRMMEMSHD